VRKFNKITILNKMELSFAGMFGNVDYTNPKAFFYVENLNKKALFCENTYVASLKILDAFSVT